MCLGENHMSYLLSWSEWINLKESNARKRAVTAAMNGTGPSLPGSYAACPVTNPYAMDIAFKTGVVGKRKKKKRKSLKLEGNEKKPDYSFDSWLKKVDKLEKQLKDLYDNGEKSEKDLDKNKKDDKSLDNKDLDDKKLKKDDKDDKSLKNKDLDDKEKSKSDKSSDNKDLEDKEKEKSRKSLDDKDLKYKEKEKSRKSLENKDLEDNNIKGNKWDQFTKMKKVSEEKPSSKDLKKS